MSAHASDSQRRQHFTTGQHNLRPTKSEYQLGCQPCRNGLQLPEISIGLLKAILEMLTGPSWRTVQPKFPCSGAPRHRCSGACIGCAATGGVFCRSPQVYPLVPGKAHTMGLLEPAWSIWLVHPYWWQEGQDGGVHHCCQFHPSWAWSSHSYQFLPLLCVAWWGTRLLPRASFTIPAHMWTLQLFCDMQRPEVQEEHILCQHIS